MKRESAGDRIIPQGETQVLRTRPGFMFVLLYRQAWWLGPAIIALVIHAVMRRVWTPDPAPWLMTGAWAWLVLGFFWRICEWLARGYIVTDRRIIVRAGILNVVGADIPLRRIQHTTVTRTFLEQMFDLGTVGVATAGADGAAINLLMVPRPNQVLEAIRAAVQRAPADRERAGAKVTGVKMTGVPVIGLAGGIGSGKSEVARILASLGCVVVDSDKEAKEALDRPEVKEQLVRWWGEGVLGEGGRVNRRAVADIVFKSDKDRAALEALVHPLVRARRADLRREAAGAPAAVIDAPLLFEAGVDAECDFVIFVDSPREVRVARVRETRGWDEAEVERRERAQMPLDEKRRKSTVVVVNDGTTEELRRRVGEALSRLTSAWKERI